MTHQEIENEDGTIVDVWDELPDADDPDLAPEVPDTDTVRTWAVEGGISVDLPDESEADLTWLPSGPDGEVV